MTDCQENIRSKFTSNEAIDLGFKSCVDQNKLWISAAIIYEYRTQQRGLRFQLGLGHTWVSGLPAILFVIYSIRKFSLLAYTFTTAQSLVMSF